MSFRLARDYGFMLMLNLCPLDLYRALPIIIDLQKALLFFVRVAAKDNSVNIFVLKENV